MSQGRQSTGTAAILLHSSWLQDGMESYSTTLLRLDVADFIKNSKHTVYSTNAVKLDLVRKTSYYCKYSNMIDAFESVYKYLFT